MFIVYMEVIVLMLFIDVCYGMFACMYVCMFMCVVGEGSGGILFFLYFYF